MVLIFLWPSNLQISEIVICSSPGDLFGSVIKYDAKVLLKEWDPILNPIVLLSLAYLLINLITEDLLKWTPLLDGNIYPFRFLSICYLRMSMVLSLRGRILVLFFVFGLNAST